MTLDELDAAYAAMTPGEYQHDPETRRITAPVRRVKKCTGTIAAIHLGLRTLSEAEADGAGFVALHNAFPALRDRLKRAEELLARAEQALLPLATAAHDAGVCVGCVTATELETARKVREEILAAIETQRATT